MPPAFSHTNTRGKTYFLHSKIVNLRGGRQQSVYYFAKQPGADAIAAVPTGYKVVESERTGLPILKKA